MTTNKIYVNNHHVPKQISNIVYWASDRNIIDGGTSKDQCLNLVQEVSGLSNSLCKGRNPAGDIGNCLVALAIIAEQHNLTISNCLEHAYSAMIDNVDEEGVDCGHA